MPEFEDEDMYEIFEGFIIETAEILDQISQDLMLLENSPEDLSLINQLFRSFHTIKGTSSFMGFSAIANFTHEAEDLLNKLRKEELKVSAGLTEILFLSRDAIEKMVSEIRADEPVSDFSKLLQMIEKAKNNDLSEGEADKSLLDTISNMEGFGDGDGDFSEDEEAMLQAAFAEINAGIADETHEIDEKDQPSVENKKNEPIEEKATGTPPLESPNKIDQKTQNKTSSKSNNSSDKKPPTVSETIRIDIDRVEALMDLSGELVLSRNRLAQISQQLEADPTDSSLIPELIDNYTQIDKVTSDIQNSIMKMRMVQVGKLYQKAPRIVRDLSREFDKKIKLVVSGEDTEIDRTIIEELNDPLVHMIRNSCDHGIEPKGKRMIAGKPEEGHIYLDAYQEGNNIILKIGDDGAGIDPEVIRSKSIEKGIISEAEAMEMSDKDIIQLIFAPGFSTAQSVSNVSGRGVGMDVVKTNIKKLKGSIEIKSEVGKGSTFIIKLPLTLAIIQGLLIGVGDEVFAIPLTSVDEVVTVRRNEIEIVNSRPVIRIRSEIIPVYDLKKVLFSDLQDDKRDLFNIVIVAHGIGKSGIIVDNLRGQQEIVIKSLGQILQGTTGIAGSTILGDGRVIMILDISELLENDEEKLFLEESL